MEPWTGVRPATSYGPVACQQPSPLEAMFESQRQPTSEDCLTLNVWTPALDGGRRPVMVWIHGGAFVTGSGSTPWYDGTSFAEHHDVVVVTVNYRLGALGFLHLADLLGEEFAGSGNNGILDQTAALRWVQDNISAFGGDPGNVTIFGESAGGMSVGTLLALPAARGLFHRAILQSGAGHNALPADHAAGNARRLLARLDIDPADARRLVGVAVDDLLEAQGAVVQETWESGMAFQPVVDGTTLPQRPIDAIGAGSSDGIAVMTGTNLDEMRLFTVMDPSLADLDDAALLARATTLFGSEAAGAAAVETYRAGRDGQSLVELWSAMETDHVFRIPSIRLAERRSESTFEYLFTWATPVFGGQLKSCHALEIPFVFNALDAPGASFFTGEANDEMRSLASTMHEAWASFARDGQPKASGLPDWPAYTADRRATMVFDVAPRVDIDPAPAERALWATAL